MPARSPASSTAPSASRSAASPARCSTSTPKCAAKSSSSRSRRSGRTGGWSRTCRRSSHSATARSPSPASRSTWPSEARPLIDKAVSEQVAALEARLRSDPVDRAGRARAMGQDVPLDSARRRQDRPAAALSGNAPGARRRGAAAASTRATSRSPSACRRRRASRRRRPSRPVRSRRSSSWCRRWTTASSRSACRSTCRSPSINKILEAQLKGHHFPRTRTPGRRRGEARSLGAAGDRLLIALHVKAREKQELVRLRRRGRRADLGQAGARSAEPDPAAHRYFAGRGIGSGLRPARRRGARRRALSASRRSPTRR